MGTNVCILLVAGAVLVITERSTFGIDLCFKAISVCGLIMLVYVVFAGVDKKERWSWIPKGMLIGFTVFIFVAILGTLVMNPVYLQDHNDGTVTVIHRAYPESSPSSEPRVAVPDIPTPYYTESQRPMCQSIDEVVRLLGSGFVTPYQADTFDCSEMAAFVEWKLENRGFDAKMCISNDFAGEGVGHAWVAVDLPVRRYYIEPTSHNYGTGYTFMVVQPFQDRYSDYDDYERVYDDVYELAKHEPLDEYDWWQVLDFEKQVECAY